MTLNVSKQWAGEMYYRMRLIRRFEERVAELVDTNEIAGVCHEYIGQEAVATGVCAALKESDVITSTHRGHGHIIGKGGKTRYMLAELFGRTTGYNKGRGGSMHIADMSLGIYGANGIVGAGTPIACGAAYKFKRDESQRVAVPFFGDGAINQGVVHESMNLAAIWNLPVVFACENNMYAITTPVKDVSKLPLHRRAEAYGMPSQLVDGMDVKAVYEATQVAVERARSGNGPTFLEFSTYRYVGHYSAEKRMKTSYRTEDEITQWKTRDAIVTWGQRLMEEGILIQQDISRFEEEVESELDEAINFAKSSPLPDPQTAMDYGYSVNYSGHPAWGFEQ